MADFAPRPRFSIIIPAFNARSTIARAIESILAQSYAVHEIIVIDDGSTDGTTEAAARFGAPVSVHRQANAGVSAARNAGARLATGDWLAFLDADDWYHPHRLKWHAQLLARNPTLELLSGDYEYHITSRHVVERSIIRVPFGRELLATAEASRDRILSKSSIARYVAEYFGHVLTLSIRHDLFTRVGGFPQGFPVAEDLHLFVRACAAVERLGIVVEPMAAYVIHEHSAVRRDRERAQREAVRALVDLRNRVRDASPEIQQAALGLVRGARLDLAAALLRSSGRVASLRAALPLLVENPSWTAVRDVGGLLRG